MDELTRQMMAQIACGGKKDAARTPRRDRAVPGGQAASDGMADLSAKDEFLLKEAIAGSRQGDAGQRMAACKPGAVRLSELLAKKEEEMR